MKLLFALLICMAVFACKNDQPSIVTSPGNTVADLAGLLLGKLQDGDLVMRTDDDIVGLTMRSMNDSDKTFSHSGILFKEDTTWYVYNMMAGEENPSMVMRRDTLMEYINPTKKSGFGIFRYDLADAEKDTLHRILQQQYQMHLKFDSSFNLSDDKEMYCSEMVAKNLQAATNGRIKILTTHKENFSFKATPRGRQAKQNIDYIALDNLYLNAHCKMIIQQRFARR